MQLMARRTVKSHDTPGSLVVTTLLSLWTPQMSSRPALYERAVPIALDLLTSEHDGVKYASTCLLQTIGRVRPDLLESRLGELTERVK